MNEFEIKEDLVDNHLLIIGGSGRNVGKTTLALEIINHYHLTENITGLKVSTHKIGEESFHGQHTCFNGNEYIINKENQEILSKDTAKMVSAGAKSAYYIQTPDNLLCESYLKFKELYYTAGPLVCESRSLRKQVKPGLFILLLNTNDTKQDIEIYKHLANHVQYFDPNNSSLKELAARVVYDSDGWHLTTPNNILLQYPDVVL